MSDTQRARRALSLFDAALEVPAEAREAWVARECAGDAALLREVLGLLDAAHRSDGILETNPVLGMEGGLAESLGAALDGRYTIEREIGRGGMATVFLAHERKHDRDVVIKVLDPAIAHLFGAERFLREVRIAATLAHPHIVPLIDSGEADGFLYYVMPWMEGETLRERMRHAPLAPDEARAILRDVAGALAFAHESGIIHRDLKPENVLLTAGHAYLLDFGIAKLLDEAPGALSITSPGLPLGTRRYMAPEQAVGAADVDARADVFAWGILGVETLTGIAVPPVGASAAASRLLATRPDIPVPLAALLQSCLSEQSVRRPDSMAEVVQRLDAIWSERPAPGEPTPGARAGARRKLWTVGVIGAVIIVAVVAAWQRDRTPVDEGPIAQPVAVSVLQNETGDSTLDVLGRFAGDWVTEGLQRVGAVRVVPWSDARHASERARAAGMPLVSSLQDELRAGTVVTGSIYRRRDSLHFHAQLIDSRSGRVVVSLPPVIVPIDSNEAGISQLRDRVMGAVASMRDERVAALPGFASSPPSFPAYQAFDVGFDHFLGQRYAEALTSFREAFGRDTTFTLALLMGARAAWNSDLFAVAESLVARARGQKRDLGVYHESSLRFLEALLAGDGAAARVAIQRAASTTANARANFDYAASLLNSGQAREARALLLAMNPDRGELRGWSSYWTQRAHAAYLLGEHGEALQAAREMARRYPDRRVAQVLQARALASAAALRQLDSSLTAWDSLPADVYWSQGAAMIVAGEELMRRGRTADGEAHARRGVTWLTNRLVALPTNRGHRYWIGSGLYDLGRYAEARPYFEGLAKEFPERLSFRGMAALSAARTGDRAAAARWLATPPPRERGALLLYEARLAAIDGDGERAITLLTDALEAGVDGFPWVPGLAFREFEPLERTARGRAILGAR
ncbi:MAG: protein kinase [Gemmatimonadaceae bacterium]|nr:protein kinase [Gemmatimonadaceae bacterium]